MFLSAIQTEEQWHVAGVSHVIGGPILKPDSQEREGDRLSVSFGYNEDPPFS